jgi:hypothetical protein
MYVPVPRAPRRALAIRPMVVVGSDVMGWFRLMRSVRGLVRCLVEKNVIVKKKEIFFLFWSSVHFVSCFP